MSNITLADGLPAWEGAAVRFGAPGKSHRGRHYVHGFEAGRVHLGHEHYAAPDALVLDLCHLPTFAHLAYRMANAHAWLLEVDPPEVWSFYTCESRLVATVESSDDLHRFYLAHLTERRK